MQGFLPKGIGPIQQIYYTQIGSRKQGMSWVKKLCGKLIDATHALWRKRNSYEHDRTIHGLREIEDVRLEEAVKRQYVMGRTGLHASDKYLFNKTRLELWSYRGEYVRTWLATILIARGEYEIAQEEMSNHRGSKNKPRKRTTQSEIILQRKRRRTNDHNGQVYNF